MNTQKQTPNDDGQYQLIPDTPLNGELARIPLSRIPDKILEGSRQPSPAMVQNIQRFGVLTPILVCPFDDTDPTPNYKVLAGRRRTIGAKKAGQEYINAVIFPAGTTPHEAVTLIENEQRSENPLVELENIEALLAKQATMEDIIDAIGTSRKQIEARMRLANLIPELRALLRENKLAVGVAEKAARLTVTQQQDLYTRADGKKITGKDVIAMTRAKALDAAVAPLPGSILSGAPDLPEDGAYTAPQGGNNGLTVAIGGKWEGQTPEAFALQVAVGLSIRDEAEAVATAKALLLWLNPENDPFVELEPGNISRLESELRLYVSTREQKQEGGGIETITEADAPPVVEDTNEEKPKKAPRKKKAEADPEVPEVEAAETMHPEAVEVEAAPVPEALADVHAPLVPATSEEDFLRARKLPEPDAEVPAEAMSGDEGREPEVPLHVSENGS